MDSHKSISTLSGLGSIILFDSTTFCLLTESQTLGLSFSKLHSAENNLYFTEMHPNIMRKYIYIVKFEK